MRLIGVPCCTQRHTAVNRLAAFESTKSQLLDGGELGLSGITRHAGR